MWITRTVLIVILSASLWPADTNTGPRGREYYEKRCTGCHALDNVKVGPSLRGVYGRRAAADPAFPYSDALKKAAVVWDDSTLDRWLADPEAVAPDNDMAFRLNRAEERAAIIAFLKQLPAKPGRK
jgi:cytochrome c